MMLYKFNILGVVGLAFFALSSVAEAKVCLAIDQDDCDVDMAKLTEKADDSVAVLCPSYFNLTAEVQPVDENHTCVCNSCKDSKGMHYACQCSGKEPEECTDTCEAHQWVETCTAGCNSTPFTLPQDPEVTATKTECEYMGQICGKDCYKETMTNGNGWWGALCCSDSDCKATTELPLFCFNGTCRECSTYSDCEVTAPRYQSKYGSGGFYRGMSDSGPFRSSKETYEWADTRYKSKTACCDGECISQYCEWCRETHGASTQCNQKQ